MWSSTGTSKIKNVRPFIVPPVRLAKKGGNIILKFLYFG